MFHEKRRKINCVCNSKSIFLEYLYRQISERNREREREKENSSAMNVLFYSYFIFSSRPRLFLIHLDKRRKKGREEKITNNIIHPGSMQTLRQNVPDESCRLSALHTAFSRERRKNMVPARFDYLEIWHQMKSTCIDAPSLFTFLLLCRRAQTTTIIALSLLIQRPES
jgi:hypothetical protein